MDKNIPYIAFEAEMARVKSRNQTTCRENGVDVEPKPAFSESQ